MPRTYYVLLLVFLTSAPAFAGGHVFNANFSVMTPRRETKAQTKVYARQILDQAERYRKEIAEEWLGAELPEGVGRTHINVAFSASQDRGLTWPDDGPRRTLHTLFLTTSPERAGGHTLKHELCHVVFATRFPADKRLPTWIEEGIASRYDDAQRGRSRQKVVRWWEETGNWPAIDRILMAERLPATDRIGYTVAASLTEFLLSRRDKSTLVRFAQEARADLPSALRAHYQISSVADLKVQWQTWVAGQQGK